MANFTPQLGVMGIYSCREPFNQKLLANVLYTPVALRTFTDIIASGVDPFTEYYNPQGISKEDYTKDVQDGVVIISFQSGNGTIIPIPSSYVTGQPNMGGVPYRTMMLVALLAPIPDTYDLSFLQQRIQDTVFDTLGVTGTVTPVVASDPTVLSQAEHDSIDAARQVVIANNKTDYAKYLDAMRQLADARAQLALLNQYIIDHPAAP